MKKCAPCGAFHDLEALSGGPQLSVSFGVMLEPPAAIFKLRRKRV